MKNLLIIATILGIIVGTFPAFLPFYRANAGSVTMEANPIPASFREGSAVLAVNVTTREQYDGQHSFFHVLMYDNKTKEPIKDATFWLNITEMTDSNEKIIFTELFRSETGKTINLEIVNINDSRNASMRGATVDKFLGAIMPERDSNDTSITIMTPFISHKGNYKISFVVIGAEYQRPTLIDEPYKMNYYWDGQSDDIRQIKIVPEFATLTVMIMSIAITSILLTTRIYRIRYRA